MESHLSAMSSFFEASGGLNRRSLSMVKMPAPIRSDFAADDDFLCDMISPPPEGSS
jgi:hypothetical protein